MKAEDQAWTVPISIYTTRSYIARVLLVPWNYSGMIAAWNARLLVPCRCLSAQQPSEERRAEHHQSRYSLSVVGIRSHRTMQATAIFTLTALH